MKLNIKIQNFEGPFDLLLHLIKQNKMDIYNIKICEITNQYIDYLNKMSTMDLEIKSEFIVMAATLIEIKSRALLPHENKDNCDEADEFDSKKKLMDKLIEYEKFKYAALYLKERQKYVGTTFCKNAEVIEEKNNKAEDFLENVSITKLFKIYVNLIKLYNKRANHNLDISPILMREDYKIDDKIQEIKQKINERNKYKFSKLISECKNKMEIIVSFLALLELTKSRYINIYQNNNFEEIFIERVENNGKR